MPLDSGSAQDLYVVGLEPAGLDEQILALTDRAFGPGRYAKEVDLDSPEMTAWIKAMADKKVYSDPTMIAFESL